MRRVLSILLLLLIALNVSAQIEEPRRRIEIGVSGGINLNTIDLQPTMRQEMHKGINGGLSIRYTSEKYFSMICAAQLEVNFSQRGWKEDFDDKTGNWYSRTLNYIEVPLLAHLSWGKEERGFQFFVNIGPQFGFFINDSEEYNGNWNPEERPVSLKPIYGKDVQNSFDYGIIGGAGVELKTKAGNFFIEGRYYYGLADIFRNSKTDPFGRSANQTISARLGYSIVIFR
ncbi:MAG: PorT family protein [Bacteroidaceae bacterium]|nr:PorT family protein [Bacteroidaceae bacterium]